MTSGEARINVPMDRIRAFCEKYGVCEFSLFGSALRDDFGPESDVDVMLQFSPGFGFTFENTPTILEELEAIFGRSIDVVEKGRISNPFRRRSIMRSRKVIHAA